MARFSANLGFLWNDLPLPDAIRAAALAGFDAVECHWPYDVPAEDVATALAETGLAMLGLNTRRGDLDAGENGVAALPGRENDARAFIDEAITYAVAIKAAHIHVMAGFAAGQAAHDSFMANLDYACKAATAHGITILIEPLNGYDAPGYFLNSSAQAKAIIDEVGASNLKLMFDCYHIQRLEGNLTTKLTDLFPIIGHIQFAAVPDRGAPDHGEVYYPHIYAHLDAIGYRAPLGAEYKTDGDTDNSLGWLKTV
ncbi:TIM barrel protein [Alphaproteobacteria bacterium]|nr:TIM barrel protein [Alphaproteobacteria bacterium]